MFKGEALGLEALRAAGGVCVPKVLHYDDDGSGGSYIIMEKLNMGGRVNMKDFGRKLEPLDAIGRMRGQKIGPAS
eukprot:g28012.t1